MLDEVQLLKLSLMAEGVAVAPRVREVLGGRPLTLADYATTSGISLVLGEEVWVNAPLQDHNPNFVSEAPPHVLDWTESGYAIFSPRGRFPARLVPVPDYYNEKNSSEEPYTAYAHTHADRVRLSPVEGCGMICTFCDLPYRYAYRRKRIDGLIDAIVRAVEDRALPARHALISGGTPREEDFDFLRTVYREIPSRFPDLPIDIMMVPVPGLLDLNELSDVGIYGLSINLEIFNWEIARRTMRQKHNLGQRHYLDFIERAVSCFGLGRVRSLLLVGLEPIEDTLRGVEALAERGCDPVLSPFRPDPATPMWKTPPPTAELLAEVYVRALEVVERYGVKLGPRCIACQHNTLTFPDASGAYYYH